MATLPRILFVDDEPAILSAEKRLFRREPYEIETAPDGATGLKLFRVFRPAVVVSDLRMPGMSGVDFLKAVREIDPEPVRVMLTGCTDLPAAETAINQGEVWRFITKPWNDEDLKATVAGAVERFRLVAENRILLDKLASIGLMAGGVAHELNNPLGGILAYSQMLRKDVDPRSDLAHDVGLIEEAAKRCKRIVGDLLAFARSSPTTPRAMASLTEAAEKAITLARFQVKGAIEITLQAGEAVPPVLIDAGRIEQVILNLVSNAVQAVSSGSGKGKVVVRSALVGDEVRLTVTDDGPGIAPENVGRIFDAFFTTKAPGQGTGLGLTVSQGIVRDHGGRLQVESTPGKGATFTLSLPVTTREQTSVAA